MPTGERDLSPSRHTRGTSRSLAHNSAIPNVPKEEFRSRVRSAVCRCSVSVGTTTDDPQHWADRAVMSGRMRVEGGRITALVGSEDEVVHSTV